MRKDDPIKTPPITNARQWLEARRAFFIGLTITISLAMLLVAGIRNPVDYDGYWHLRMGMDWLAHGLSPWTDHYSFTFNGEPIRGVPVAFQTGLYGLVTLFGERGGMITGKLIMFGVTFLSMLLWLRSIKAPTLGWTLGLLLLVIALQLRAQVRPELISYAFIILGFLLYERSRLECTLRTMAPVLLLMLIWTNHHSPVLGYVIFTGLFVDIGIRMLREKATFYEWTRSITWGLALLGVGALRPGFGHPLLELIGFTEEWKPYIREYATPTFMLDGPIPYLLIPIAVSLLIVLLAQRKFGLLLVAGVFTFAALNIGRMVAPAALVYAVLLPLVYRDALQGAGYRTMKQSQARIYHVGMVALSVATLAIGVWFSRAIFEENRSSWSLFPKALVNYMQSSGKSGRIFNDYATGGYLIYKLSPNSKVFIDGRTGILYPPSHYLTWLTARNDPEKFLDLVKHYDIEYAVIEASDDSASLMHFAGWSLDFADARYVLFQPGRGRLHHFGKLWAEPYCWSVEQEAGITEELAFLQTPEGRSGLASPLMRFSAAYVNSDKPQEFIEAYGHEYDASDAGRRFFAARALALGASESASELIDRVELPQPRDDLVPVIAAGQAGEWTRAIALMEKAAEKKWRVVLEPERRLQLSVLEWLSSKNQLTAALTEFRGQLLTYLNDEAALKKRDITDLCIR